MAFLSCDEFRALLADEVAGAGPDGREGELRSHLGACGPCAAHAQEILWQDRVLCELSAQARREAMMARVRESILSTKPVEFAEPPLRVRSPRLRWGRAAAAAAVFLAALAGLLLFRPAGGGRVVVQRLPDVAPVRDVAEQSPPPVEETPAKAAPDVREARLPEAPAPPEPPKENVSKTALAPRKDAEPPKAPPPELPPSTAKPETARVEVRPVAAQDVVLPRRTVDEAVRLGMAFLQKRVAAIEGARLHHDLSYDELVLWTYLHGGAVKADVQRIARRMLERKLERTYAVALQAMVLEKLDAVSYQGRIQQCAQFLLDNQAKNGQWGYGDPSIFAEEVPTPPSAKAPKVLRRILVKKMRPGPESGDHSNSMYAALGLRACHDAGIVFPQDAILLAQKAWREAQIKPEGGWCYGRHEAHRAYGSMTAGGVGSLVIYAYLLGQDWKRDAAVKAGLDWMEKRFSVAFNPGTVEHAAREENTQQHYFYYLYALERAGILYGTSHLGKHDWYQKGSEALLGCQRQDGAWLSREGGNEVSDTCFAILFLKKATLALPDVPSGVRK